MADTGNNQDILSDSLRIADITIDNGMHSTILEQDFMNIREELFSTEPVKFVTNNSQEFHPMAMISASPPNMNLMQPTMANTENNPTSIGQVPDVVQDFSHESDSVGMINTTSSNVNLMQTTVANNENYHTRIGQITDVQDFSHEFDPLEMINTTSSSVNLMQPIMANTEKYYTGIGQITDFVQYSSHEFTTLAPMDITPSQELPENWMEPPATPSNSERVSPVNVPGTQLPQVSGTQCPKKKRGRKPKSEMGLHAIKKKEKKVKLYEIKTPFEDKEKERKRLNAVNTKRHRDQQKKDKDMLEQQLDVVKNERDNLKKEVEELRSKDSTLTQQLDLLKKHLGDHALSIITLLQSNQITMI